MSTRDVAATKRREKKKEKEKEKKEHDIKE